MSGIEDKISSFYRALIGETFHGTHAGIYNRRDIYQEDSTSIDWHKISMDSTTLSPKMESDLRAIVENFEGRIWKGFHNGVMYINPEHHDMDSILSVRKFKIVNFVPFPQRNYEYGCSFVLEAVN
jgi:hypothetical protein